MEVVQKKKSTSVLLVGDQIRCGVTHEVKINRDSAWIKYEATTSVQDGEEAADAEARVVEHVTTAVIEAVNKAAAKTMEASR